MDPLFKSYFGIQTVLCKLLIYKPAIKLIWAYGMPLWGTASNSNIEYYTDSKIKSSEQ